jgi:hypothetical protein
MRQETIDNKAFRGGRSFYYRDIFSGLSNEKMGPVPCIFIPATRLGIRSYQPVDYFSIVTFFFPWMAHARPFARGQKLYYTKAVLPQPKCGCVLKGASLALLKTNFAKKPKNPV